MVKFGSNFEVISSSFVQNVNGKGRGGAITADGSVIYMSNIEAYGI